MSGELLRTDVGDLTFDVRVDGPEDGRPVLLLHGFPETSASWASVTPLLTQAGLRTYAPDQLGYSPGARPGEVEAYSMQNLAQVTADLMTALEIPVADVVGHDWGANVAWTLAAWHSDRVRSLTAVSVPHPAAYTVAYRADPEQKERSAYIRLFWQEGRAEEVLLADDGRRLRRLLERQGRKCLRAFPYCMWKRTGRRAAMSRWIAERLCRGRLLLTMERLRAP